MGADENNGVTPFLQRGLFLLEQDGPRNKCGVTAGGIMRVHAYVRQMGQAVSRVRAVLRWVICRAS